MSKSSGLHPMGPVDANDTASSAMPKFSLGLVLYILFRHKWLVLALTLIGVAAALVARKLIEVPWVSEARVLIRYVEERQSPTASEEGSRVRSVEDRGGRNIILTEVAILNSYDLSLEVARTLGPEAILGAKSDDAEQDLRAAAGMVASGLEVNSASAVISLAYRNPDPTRIQPVLTTVIDTYLKRHVQVHRSSGGIDESLVQETDQRRSRLLGTEEELRKILEQAGVIDLAAARQMFDQRVTRLQEELLGAEAELAERRAQIAAFTGAPVPTATADDTTSGGEAPAIVAVPDDVARTYRGVLARLPSLYAREQALLSEFTAETPMVKGIRAQIAEQETLRARLEKEFPQLVSQPPVPAAAGPAVAAGATTGVAPTYDVVLENSRITATEARRRVLADQLARTRVDLAKLGSIEARITELQRARELQEEQFRYLSANLERARVDEAFGPNRVSNISILQHPSPPYRDGKQAQMVVLGLAAGGLVIGLALAVLIELFLDQSLRRSGDIEASIGLPLIMAIPRIKKASLPSRKPPLLLKEGKAGAETPTGAKESPGAMVPWSANSGLREFFDALRNRVVYSFEMRNITRKPKLVAVTSCGPGTGVSTVAAGLAASLSETGDGNVLLVDMNPDRKSAQFFHRGDLKVGLNDALEHEKRDDALVRENLYVVSQDSEEERLNWLMPKRFATLVPKLKASDYDYIIFDLPPVSQISATPQLARFMDQVLLVVESEKTAKDSARRAGTILSEAGANVAVVLNKTRDYVPSALVSESMSG